MTEIAGHQEIDGALQDLKAGSARWATMPLGGRRALLDALAVSVAGSAEEWVALASAYKGLDPGSPLVGEEWLSGPYSVLTAIGALAETMNALEKGRSPVDGFRLGSAPGGRVSIDVLPHNHFDRLLLSGFGVKVWMAPGVPAAQVRAAAGLAQRTPGTSGGVGAVLGAGNITSIPPLDVLYEIYAHNRAVLLKLNPVTDPLLTVFGKAFAPLIEAGMLRILCGNAGLGQYLVKQPIVDHVHLTGSVATYDAIVYGTGSDGAARKAAVQRGQAQPLLAKSMTSELGGVSPTIVLPGFWSKADLRYQAEHVATQRLHNGGYNCIASQVVILSEQWPQRDAFLAELRSALDRAPVRPAYYPGSDHRVAAAKAAYPQAESYGRGGGRLLLADVRLRSGENALNTEYFAPVLAVSLLPGTGMQFFRAAIEAANDQLTGTLGVNVIAHPQTLRAAGSAFEEALVGLRYGAIGINAWTGFGFLTARAPWGAFPGADPANVESGVGVVHNALLLDHPERTIVRGPFRPVHRGLGAGELTLSPKPPWFVTNRTASVTGRLLTRFAAEPRWSRLPAIFASALRG